MLIASHWNIEWFTCTPTKYTVPGIKLKKQKPTGFAISKIDKFFPVNSYEQTDFIYIISLFKIVISSFIIDVLVQLHVFL